MKMLAMLAFLIGRTMCVFCQPIDSLKPSNPPRLVNDYARVIGTSEVGWLEDKLLLFERETSNEVSIVTVTGLADKNIEEYAVELATRWGIGKKGRDNGVLVLLAPNERKVRIEVGLGLEHVLTDALCARIIRKEMLPLFEKGYFYDGLENGTTAIMEATKGEYQGGNFITDMYDVSPRWLIIIVLIVGVNGLIWSLYKFFNWIYFLMTGRRVRRREYSYTSTTEPLSSSSSSNSNSDRKDHFGGYGGGKFGGGGATGSW